jgi:choice-of-anchor A domain-containing protein
VVTPCRHTFSGLAVVTLLATTLAVGSVSGAPAHAEPQSAFAATDACPNTWPALNAGSPADFFDGNVSVLAGGNLLVAGGAAGAEGLVVAQGDATFARDIPGTYEVGVTGVGSQVPPYANSDMLAVGGSLSIAPGTHVDVGRGLGADVVVGGDAAKDADIETHGGRVDSNVAHATQPYNDLADQVAVKSAGYAALPSTGTVDVTDTAITLTGDGVSNPQVFTVDGAGLGALEGLVGRSLQVLGVPDGAAVVVNLTGPAVDLDVDLLLSPAGLPVDPFSDPYFADLTTHLLWNAVSATTVGIGGLAQLPGSLLVPTQFSTTTLSGAGTNGRVLVGGDLVHTGAGQLHSYPFLPDSDLRCTPQQVPVGTLTLDLALDDPDHVVADDRVFMGRFECRLDGDNVTPADDSWRMPAGADTRVLSDQIPVGAVCTITERLDDPPARARNWSDPVFQPTRVVVAKREARGFKIVNRVKPLPVEPPSAPPTSPTDTPTLEAEPPPSPDPTPSATPSSVVEPTNRPEPSASPSASPTQGPVDTPTAQPTAQAAPGVEPPRGGGGPGPLTTTAPFTLRGAFVWGPVMMLSLLTLLLRIRRRPRYQRVH